MTDFSGDPSLWLERTLGAAAGALVSLVYMVPRGRQEAASRLAAGLVCGLVFGGEAGLWLAGKLYLADRLSASEIMLSGSAAASLSAWWVLGLLTRIADRAGRDRTPD